MRIGRENDFIVVEDAFGPRNQEICAEELMTVTEIFPQIPIDFLHGALTYHEADVLIHALVVNTIGALPLMEVPAPDARMLVEEDEEDVEHDESVPAEVYEGYKRIFAETAAQADGISVFFAGSPHLVTVDQPQLDFLSKTFRRCPMRTIRIALKKFHNHVAPAFASLFAIENELTVRGCGGWYFSDVDRRLNKGDRPLGRPDVLDDAPPNMRRETELIMRLGRIGVWIECEVCCEERPEKHFLQCSPANESTGDTAHRFCDECVRNLAQQLVDGSALLRGCAGIPCMDPGCDRIFSCPEARKVLPKDLRRRIDERLQEANLLAAGIRGLERCKTCNLAVELDVPKEVNKVFSCVRCGAEHCRVCEHRWDDAHFGRRCEEVGDFVFQQYESKMTEAVTRMCEVCSLVFVKADGCNLIHCRCGITSCYLCAASRVDYDHFCRHVRTPGQRCGDPQCTKQCTLWMDATTAMNQDLERIREEARYDARIAERLEPVAPKRMKMGGVTNE